MAEQNSRITRKMHLQLNSRIKPLALLMSLALLASCASSPNKPPVAVEDRDIIGQDNTLEPFDEGTGAGLLDTAPLRAEELNVTKGDYYRQQAENAVDQASQIDDALSAAEYYIQGQDFERAYVAADILNGAALTQVQSDRLTVIKAYVAYARGQYQESLLMLQPLWQRVDTKIIVQQRYENENSRRSRDNDSRRPDVEEEPVIPDAPILSTQQVDALLLASFNFQALNDIDSALEALIRRERSLYGRARAETTRYIWQIVSSLSEQQRQSIVQTTQNRFVLNRLEYRADEQVGLINQAPQQFNKWREDDTNQAPKDIFLGEWNSNSPRQIAVLLPMSSKFNKAATALKDGIMMQHDQNHSPFRPQLKFYDIGAQVFETPQYYSAAIQSGADFIIGPLGKDYANQISRYSGGRVDTLLLGGDAPLSSNLSRFDLSPEMEGKRTAERAWKDGHLSVAIMSDGSNYNRRSIDGFSKSWLKLGGKITKSVVYSPAQYDHSAVLKELFQINQSQYRHSQISKVLGFKPKFSEYKRNDVDFILMLSDAKTGRLLRPQINFFSGSSVPVYATSKIFNGIADNINNMDLDKTRFPIMPWVLKSSQVTPYAGLLNQLFALGSDAYTVAGNFSQLRSQSSAAFNGRTGQVSIDLNGEVINQPVWATFKGGAVEPVETLGLDITPIDELNSDYSINQSVNGRYNGKSNRFNNSKTYDSRTWDKSKSEPKNK
jgi:outer membrane PBP1 activator LpoA protein